MELSQPGEDNRAQHCSRGHIAFIMETHGQPLKLRKQFIKRLSHLLCEGGLLRVDVLEVKRAEARETPLHYV